MTTNDVIQHVQAVQRRVNDRVIKRLGPLGRTTPRKRVAPDPDEARDERESMARDSQEREDRAKRCVKNGGARIGQVC